MDFDEFKKKIDVDKTMLLEVHPALDLTEITAATGSNSVYVEVSRLGQRDSGFYFYPQFEDVIENGLSLTEQTGPASVDLNPGSWYFDNDGTLYVRLSSGASPSNVSLLGLFPIYFANETVTYSDKCYFPRLSDTPISISSKADELFFSTTTVGGGSISFENSDHFFDKLISTYSWKNRNVGLAIGSCDMTVGSYATVFTGRTRDMTINYDKVTFSIQDWRTYLHKQLPIRLFSKLDYPNMGQNVNGKPIPVAYGSFLAAPTYLIDSTVQKGKFKYADHPVNAVTAVYNNGILLSPTKYSLDLNNGELTISSDYAGSVGTITVDFKGVPGSNIFFQDDFTDGDLSDWDHFGAGSFNVSSGKLTGSLNQESSSGFLICPTLFYEGVIVAKVKPTSATSTWSGAGVVFDYIDEDNYKTLRIFPNTDTIYLQECNDGSLSTRDYASVTININQEYTLKLEVGPTGILKGYLNGTEYVSYDYGDHFQQNRCGVAICNIGIYEFDDYAAKYDESYFCTGPLIVKDICTRFLGIDSDAIDNDSFATAMTVAQQKVKLYLGDSRESSEKVIARLGTGNLCRFVVGATGKVYYHYWDQNDEIALDVTDEMILDGFETFDQTDDIFFKINVKYGYDLTLPDGKSISSRDNNVIYNYDREYEKQFETYLVNQYDAENLSLKLLQLVKKPILRVKVRTKIPGIDLKIGDLIKLDLKRGFTQTGKVYGAFRVIGIEKQLNKAETTLTVVNQTEALGIELCEVNCQTTCEKSCQSTCQLSCQATCQITCQSTCQKTCQVGCQTSCQTCAETGQCQTSCESSCTVSCVTGCEVSCQTGCEVSCEQTCEITCQTFCQSNCTTTCEVECQVACEYTCQEQCLIGCMFICEATCEAPGES